MSHFSKKVEREAFENFLLAKYEAYTGAQQVKSFPYYLVVDPSDACNLRCTTCPTGIENERRHSGGEKIAYRKKRVAMKPALFDSLLDELGPYLFLLMFYNWGEPLLNKWIHKFIQKAHSYGIETELHSNLSLPLSEERIESILDAGLDSLTGSIDGFSQEAYQIHRVGGNMDLIKRNLEAIVKVRDRLGLKTLISYKMLVFRHNEHEIRAARRYCKDLGISFVADDAGIHDQSWLPSYRKGEQPFYSEDRMQELYVDADAAGVPDYFPEHERHSFWFPTKKKDEAKYPDFCSWHYGNAVVSGGGPVPPCCATPKEVDDFGTFVPGQNSFAALWNNENYQHARSVLATDQPTYGPDIKTVCDRCFFPKFVQHVYSVHDAKVIAAFHREFNGKDNVLESGFRVLSRERYGWPLYSLLRRGLFHPLFMAAGRGNERDMSAYTDFFERYMKGSSAA
ncbi:MAG: radical SAM protein [Halioglobus sp.]